MPVRRWQSQPTLSVKHDKGTQMSKEPKNQDSKNQEIKLQEAKRPENLRANAMPIDGFVLSVDGKLKMRYETSKEAIMAASKLKRSYPVIQVAVYDAIARAFTPVDMQAPEK
jgi:hypothetical protein